MPKFCSALTSYVLLLPFILIFKLYPITEVGEIMIWVLCPGCTLHTS